MKLLIVINSLILAGAEVLVSQLAPLLQASGINVSILVLKTLDGPLEHALRQEHIPILSTHYDRIYSALQVRELHRQFARFDIVHTHLFPSQLWAALGRPTGSRHPILITTEHNTDNNRRRWWLRPLDRFMYSRYDHVVCNSQATLAALQQWVPRLNVEMSVIANGISLQPIANAKGLAKQDLIGRGDVPLLLSVARLQPQKDHATLLRALASLKEPAHLVLVGEGELKPELQSLAVRLGIQQRVHFLGRREDVRELLKSADIFVHATHSDGFCLAALEAMAAELPVVATRVPGLTEVVGSAGLLVSPRDPSAFAAAISALLASPERRHELAQAGLERAQNFTIEATAAAYAQLYRQCSTMLD